MKLTLRQPKSNSQLSIREFVDIFVAQAVRFAEQLRRRMGDVLSRYSFSRINVEESGVSVVSRAVESTFKTWRASWLEQVALRSS